MRQPFVKARRSARDAAAARRFVARWRAAGPALEEERLTRLQRLDEEMARAMMRDLFRLWRPTTAGTSTSGLVAQQRLFRALSSRRVRSAR